MSDEKRVDVTADAAFALSLKLNLAKAELDQIDEALARRPALADLKDRYSKVFRACEMAGRADRLERELERVLRVLEKYRNCRHGSVDCFCTVEARAELSGWKR